MAGVERDIRSPQPLRVGATKPPSSCSFQAYIMKALAPQCPHGIESLFDPIQVSIASLNKMMTAMDLDYRLAVNAEVTRMRQRCVASFVNCGEGIPDEDEEVDSVVCRSSDLPVHRGLVVVLTQQ